MAFFSVVIPAGTTYARFSLFEVNVSRGSNFDLLVDDSIGGMVGASFGPTLEEEVNLADPAPASSGSERRG
jgi:hypothetical protein